MANKARKDNKNIVIGICCAIVIAIVIVVAVVLATSGNKLDDSYFVSDDTKYVITMEADEMSINEEEKAYAPIRTHVVYTYSGDAITGMKSYAVYDDADAAKKAFDAMKEAGQDMNNIEVSGKYIIMTAAENDYKDMTASDVKAYVDAMESWKNTNSNSGETGTEDANTGQNVNVEQENVVVEE